MTDEKALVSIGVPVHNGEKHIRRALDSLLAQNYNNIEIIISDNASTDRTHDISQGYLAKDRRIRYHRNEQNIGARANFGLVLEKARGEYFMWAACDDFWMPDFVSAMVSELERNRNSSVAMCALERLSESGSLQDVVRYQGGSDPSRMSSFSLAMALASGKLYHFYIYGLFRTDFLRRAFQNYPRVIAADRLFVCQLALATRFSYVDSILHGRQVHDKPIAKRYAGEELGRISRGRCRQGRISGARK
jgi:glycosyltransferase involved in cell wall biosynthesis